MDFGNEMKTALLVLLVGVLSAGLQAAAKTSTIDPGVSSMVGNLGIWAILAWYLWYDTTHSRPKFIERFSHEMEKIREMFMRELAAQRDVFSREQIAYRDHDNREKEALRGMLVQALQGMRNAVHDVRDTAQVTMNKVAAVAQMESKQ